MKLITYQVETSYQQTFTRCWLADDTMTPADIAAEVLDAIDGTPSYFLEMEGDEKSLTPAEAVTTLLNGQCIFRDYNDGEDAEWVSQLRITSIEESEIAVLRKFFLV